MNKKHSGMRLHVSEEAERLLLDARKKLQQNGCKVIPSGVASKAIEIFFTKYFEVEKKHFEKEFFDKKSFLKKVLSESMDDDELFSESLQELMKKIRPSKSKK